MMDRLVFGHDSVIAKWASDRLGGSHFLGEVKAIGLVNAAGDLVGATVLHNASKFDIEMSIVGKPSKDLLFATAHLAFTCAERITVRIPRRKSRVMKAAVKYGFRLEGTIRRLYGPYKKDDGVIFGLLRKEATRYIGGLENVSTQST